MLRHTRPIGKDDREVLVALGAQPMVAHPGLGAEITGEQHVELLEQRVGHVLALHRDAPVVLAQ